MSEVLLGGIKVWLNSFFQLLQQNPSDCFYILVVGSRDCSCSSEDFRHNFLSSFGGSFSFFMFLSMRQLDITQLITQERAWKDLVCFLCCCLSGVLHCYCLGLHYSACVLNTGRPLVFTSESLLSAVQPKQSGLAIIWVNYGAHLFCSPDPIIRTAHSWSFSIFLFDLLLLFVCFFFHLFPLSF